MFTYPYSMNILQFAYQYNVLETVPVPDQLFCHYCRHSYLQFQQLTLDFCISLFANEQLTHFDIRVVVVRNNSINIHVMGPKREPPIAVYFMASTLVNASFIVCYHQYNAHLKISRVVHYHLGKEQCEKLKCVGVKTIIGHA